MSPSSSSMPGYPYGSSGSYAGAMYAAATSTTKESCLMAAGDSINSLRLKAKQHSSSSSPTAIASSTSEHLMKSHATSYYPASVSPGKSNSSESPNLTLNPDLFNNAGQGGGSSSTPVTTESVWISIFPKRLREFPRLHNRNVPNISIKKKKKTIAFSLKYVEPDLLCFCESNVD